MTIPTHDVKLPWLSKVTRFEVIDDTGRVYVSRPCFVEVQLQDNERTLKVFVTKKDTRLLDGPRE